MSVLQKIEWALLGFAGIMVLFVLFIDPFAEHNTFLSFYLLAFFYFYTGIWLFNDYPIKWAFYFNKYKTIGGLRIFLALLCGVLISWVLVSILHMIQGQLNADKRLALGMLMLLVYNIILLVLRKKLGTPYLRSVYLRTITYLIIGAFCYYLSTERILDFRFRDYPEYQQKRYSTD